jgi:hypothetical protein
MIPVEKSGTASSRPGKRPGFLTGRMERAQSGGCSTSFYGRMPATFSPVGEDAVFPESVADPDRIPDAELQQGDKELARQAQRS